MSYPALWLRVSLLFCLALGSSPGQAVAFFANFDNADGTVIRETGTMDDSADADWWLNSGAQIQIADGIAASVQGKLPATDRFRLLYARANPTDTDQGFYPQNLLRLVTRAKFKDFTQQVFFNIQQVNVSASPNRNQSNGVFFFHRYQDGDNLYYVGIRVDGTAVIKKKLAGKYHTLKSVAVYPGLYQRDTQVNLLPLKRWIGMRTVIANDANDAVSISLYLNDSLLGSDWVKILQVTDSGVDAVPILDAGYAGIRTDFMDIQFDAYAAVESGE